MVLDARYQRLDKLRVALSVVTMPVEYAVNLPFQFATWLHTALTSREQLLTENTYLHAKELILQARVQKLLALQQENAQLRALLQSAPKDSDKILVAQLMAVETNPFVEQVVLDKGSRDEVYVGQPVLDEQGIVGQVIAVEPLSSRVMLLTDNQSAIPVQIVRNGLRGIVEGNGADEPLSLLHVTQTNDIQRGDILVTSGLGQRFPLGYPLGEVRTIKRVRGRRFVSVAVAPKASLNHTRQVLLVWPAAGGLS